MSDVSLVLNIFWIVFGGLWMAVAWAIAGVVMAITIVGLPWTRAAFNMGFYTLLPFGQKAVSRAAHTGEQNLGTGPLGSSRQYRVADPRGLVARARTSHLRHRPRHHHYRHPLCVGAREACGDRALADRQDDRAGRRRAAAIPTTALTPNGSSEPSITRRYRPSRPEPSRLVLSKPSAGRGTRVGRPSAGAELRMPGQCHAPSRTSAADRSSAASDRLRAHRPARTLHLGCRGCRGLWVGSPCPMQHPGQHRATLRLDRRGRLGFHLRRDRQYSIAPIA